MPETPQNAIAAPRCVVLHNCDYESAVDAADGSEPPSVAADAEVAETAHAVAQALAAAGWWVTIETVRDDLDALPGLIARHAPDVVFNLVESLARDSTREAETPEALARLSVPFTGNRAEALRVAYAKDDVRARLLAARVPGARGVSVPALEELDALLGAEQLGVPFPLFVKPARTHASIGIDQGSLVRDADALRARVDWLLRSVGAPVLVEEYLPGWEINVAIFPEPYAGSVVPTRIDFSAFPDGLAPIVTYDCKWSPDSPEYAATSRPCATELGPELLAEVEQVARRAFAAIGCTSYGRVDLRLDLNGRPRVIDINPNCDIHPDAGMVVAARSVGVDHAALIETIARHALTTRPS
jgi:D-alanine-D-alanine ligase